MSMSANGRKPFMAGNWKMNTDLASAVSLAKELADLMKGVDASKVDVAVIPPFPFIRDVKTVRAQLIMRNQLHICSATR